jgi:hypothetical protein
MRVPAIDHGHKLREKILMVGMRLVTGQPVPDVVKTLLYRRDYWGDPYNALLQPVMRGPSSWSVGERELFAAFVSNLNRCRF